MVDVLETKRAATRFRILVEIADRQPAVSQGEIAEAVGVTNQAVSEYIREFVEEEFVEKEGQSRYHVTKEGVEWLFTAADDVRRYADHVTDDVLGGLREDAAIATEDVAGDEKVALLLADGLLRADPTADGPPTGRTTGPADRGEDVGVTGFAGDYDPEPGTVEVIQVPSIRAGGSRAVESETLAEACADADVITCAGVEAVIAARHADVSPDTWFAPGDVAADAATRGVRVVVLATTDRVGQVTAALGDASVGYTVSEVSVDSESYPM